MKFVLFYHSLVSDWNHGNAHFLRGVVSELLARGHQVDVYEPAAGWSITHLLEAAGPGAISDFKAAYPELASIPYTLETLDVERTLDGADVVIVHEWNDAELIARVGRAAAHHRCRLLFHDTHHRSVTDPASIAALDLRHYDGVLAFGRPIADRYLRNGWTALAWIWHEAADIRRFYPHVPDTGNHPQTSGDLVWIGNWGDDERAAELKEFLIEPVKMLGLHAAVHGVRYPEDVRVKLDRAGIRYRGWIANFHVPQVFARYRCTVHVPRRAYVEALPGIPTIRMFEALACGIPLVSGPWSDVEHLFRPDIDYLVARDGRHMQELLRTVLNERDLAASLRHRGLETIRARHTCAHRADELLRILAGLHAADQATNNRRPVLA